MIPPIPPTPPAPTAPGGATGAPPPHASPGFGAALGGAINHLQVTQAAANQASIGTAAGTVSIANEMVATSTAELSTQLTVAVRNAAMTSLTQIMQI